MELADEPQYMHVYQVMHASEVAVKCCVAENLNISPIQHEAAQQTTQSSTRILQEPRPWSQSAMHAHNSQQVNMYTCACMSRTQGNHGRLNPKPYTQLLNNHAYQFVSLGSGLKQGHRLKDEAVGNLLSVISCVRFRLRLVAYIVSA